MASDAISDRPLLEVEDLTVCLRTDDGPVPVVDRVAFSIAPREVLALVGESGCGKTVTAHSLLGLLPRELHVASGRIAFRPDSGERPIDLASPRLPRRRLERLRGAEIAMIFQEPMSSFSPVHTMGDQVGEPLRVHRNLSKRAARDAAIELLGRVGIGNPADAVDRYPHEFSGGMRQRAMIAKALSCNPRLLIADEPTTALDVTIQAQILSLLKDLQREFGMAVLFITHDLGVVAQVASTVAIMYTGRIVERGATQDVFHDARHPYTVDLLRAVPQLGDLRERRELEPIRGVVPRIIDLPSGCTFHPRCRRALPGLCEREVPRPVEVSGGHEVRCHLFGEGAAS